MVPFTLPCVWNKTGIEDHLKALGQLIIGRDFTFQQVVGVPLLQKGQPVFGNDIFRFQTTRGARCFSVVFTDHIEVHSVGGASFHVELEDVED